MYQTKHLATSQKGCNVMGNKVKTIVHVDPENYTIDNRSDVETELQFETEDTRFIVRVDPWALLDDLLGNLSSVAASFEINGWRDTILDVANEVNERIEACIEEDSK